MSDSVLTPQAIRGPRPVPIVGPLGNLAQFFRDPIDYMGRAFEQHGPLVALAQGGRVGFSQPGGPGIVLVHGPALTREVQTQTDLFHAIGERVSQRTLRQPDSPRRQALEAISYHVLSANGERHRRYRRLLAPFFHKRHIELYHADMIALTQHMLDGWREGEPRDMRAELSRLTMSVVVKSLFGDTVGLSAAMGNTMQSVLHLSIPSILLPYDVPGLPYYAWGTACRRLIDGFEKLIARRRGQDGGSDLLSMLLLAQDEDGSGLSDTEVMGNVFAIFLAGQETSANALMWTLFLLSQHPRFAADLLTELDDLLHGAPPSVAQMEQVPLLECTIKESLRLLPPVPYSARYAAADTELGGCPIAAGTDVFVSLYHNHRLPELYAEPQRFNPYRWIGIERDVFEFTPFNSGPRMCLGAGFAMQEMKLALAMILQRCRLEFIPGTRVDRAVSFSLSTRTGLRMIVRPQDRQFARGVGGVRGNVREMVDLPA